MRRVLILRATSRDAARGKVGRGLRLVSTGRDDAGGLFFFELYVPCAAVAVAHNDAILRGGGFRRVDGEVAVVEGLGGVEKLACYCKLRYLALGLSLIHI